jgi:hypothetical protein
MTTACIVALPDKPLFHGNLYFRDAIVAFNKVLAADRQIEVCHLSKYYLIVDK